MNNYNTETGKEYEGRNQGELEVARVENNWESGEWGTFLQWKKAGYMVKKGEKSPVSVFLGFRGFEEVSRDENGSIKLKVKSRPLGFKAVFNISQVEKLDVENNK